MDKIAYLDHPELKFNEHESTQMPFRYVAGEDGKPIMPEVSVIALQFGSLSLFSRSSNVAGHG